MTGHLNNCFTHTLFQIPFRVEEYPLVWQINSIVPNTFLTFLLCILDRIKTISQGITGVFGKERWMLE